MLQPEPQPEPEPEPEAEEATVYTEPHHPEPMKSPFAAANISHIAVKDEDDEPSFIQHGRGELDEYTEVIAEYEKFKPLEWTNRSI
eukprot:COSAG02_NODE_2237_length_9416_cov_60.873779_5_plen_86_part_00